MSRSRPTGTPRKPASPPRPSKAPPNRNQVLLVVISSLVICSMLGGVFVGLTSTDFFGDLFSSGDSDENYINPNSDIISEAETEVANNPDDVEDLFLLASLLANSGRLGDAIPHYERALELAPDDVAGRLSFARALADGGMLADAELQFQRILEIDPNNQQAHYYLAQLYMTQSPQDVDAAIEHYRAAAEIDPTTLIGERSQTQLVSLGAGSPAPATPSASPISTPAG